MAQAVFNGVVIAESDETVSIEGNHYFPPGCRKDELFEAAAETSVCPWKGTAECDDVVVDGKRALGAAWFYATPKDPAVQIKDDVAFYPVVEVS